MKEFEPHNKLFENDDDIKLQNIRNKMNKIIQSKKINFLIINNEEYEGNYKLNYQFTTESKRIFLKHEIIKNILILTISTSVYVYFTKFSHYLQRINSIKYYKQIFLFTFSLCPIAISSYFSVLNYDLPILNNH
jgi:hypothetical protein